MEGTARVVKHFEGWISTTEAVLELPRRPYSSRPLVPSSPLSRVDFGSFHERPRLSTSVYGVDLHPEHLRKGLPVQEFDEESNQHSDHGNPSVQSFLLAQLGFREPKTTLGTDSLHSNTVDT